MADRSLPRQGGNGFTAMVPDAAGVRPSGGATQGNRPRPSDGYAEPAARAGRASQLFEALRAENPDVDEEELLAGPDYYERQRMFLQEKEQQKVMERLERRAATGAPVVYRGGSNRASAGVIELDPGETPNPNRASLSERPDRKSHDRRSFEARRSREHQRSSFEQQQQRRSREHQRSSFEQQQQRRSREHQRSSFEQQQQRRSREPQRGQGSPTTTPDSRPEPSGSSWTVTHRHRQGAAPEPFQTPQQRQPQTGGLDAAASSGRARDGGEGSDGPSSFWTATAATTCGTSTMPAGSPATTNSSRPDAAATSASAPATEVAFGSAACAGSQVIGAEPPGGGGGSRAPCGFMSSITEDELLAATSALASVQVAGPALGPSGPSGPGPGAGREKQEEEGSGRARMRGRRRSPSPGRSAPAASDDADAWEGSEQGKGMDTTAIGSTAVGISPVDATAERAHYRDLGQSEVFTDARGAAVPGVRAVDDPAGGAAAGNNVSAALAALGLVEVQPLSDHIQRDDDRSVRGGAAEKAGPSGLAVGGRAEGTGGRSNGPGDPSDRTITNETMATFDELGDLQKFSLPRQWAIRLCANPDFEMVVTAIIFANCITLCLSDPRHPDDEGRNRKLFWAELAFNICFSIEMLLRVVSMGSPWAYIRRPWNQFDFFMVVAGYTVFVPGNSSAVNAIRALRALRPLRTITRFESLRGVIVCFLEAIPLLASVGGLLIFFIFVYAVAAVQLFPKTYHWTCLDSHGVPLDIGDDPDMFGCGGSGRCPTNYTCVLLDKQHALNAAGYDNTGLAMLSVWQALTLTGWVFMMYRTVDTYSYAAVIYYVTLVFIGAYFVLNLFLAVLKIKFAKAQTLFHNQLALHRRKARRNSIMTLMSKVQSKWTEYSSRRSQASLLNSKLSSAISSRISSVASLRMSGAQVGGGDLDSALKDSRNLSGGGGGSGKHRDQGSVAATQPLLLPGLADLSGRDAAGSAELSGEGSGRSTRDEGRSPLLQQMGSGASLERAARDDSGLRNDDMGESWGSTKDGHVPGPPLMLAQPPSPAPTRPGGPEANFSAGPSSSSASAGEAPLTATASGNLSARVRHATVAADGTDSDGSTPNSIGLKRMGTMEEPGTSGGGAPASPLRTPARPALIHSKSSLSKGARQMRAVSFRRRESDVPPFRNSSGVAEARETPGEDDVTALGLGAYAGADNGGCGARDSLREVAPSPAAAAAVPASCGARSPAPREPRHALRRWHLRTPRRVAPYGGPSVGAGGDSVTNLGVGVSLPEGRAMAKAVGSGRGYSGPSWVMPLRGSQATAATAATPNASTPACASAGASFAAAPINEAQLRQRQATAEWPCQLLVLDTSRLEAAAATGAAVVRSTISPCEQAVAPGRNPALRVGVSRPAGWTAISPAGSAGPVAEAVRFAGGGGGDDDGGMDAPILATDTSAGIASPTVTSPRGNSNSQTQTHIARTPRPNSKEEISSPLPGRSAGAASANVAMVEVSPLEPDGDGAAAAAEPQARTASGARQATGNRQVSSNKHPDLHNDHEAGNERTYSAAPSSMGATNVAMIVMTTAEFDEFVSDHPYFERQMLRLQYRIRIFVNHIIFNQVFMLFIFINTVLLAMEYNNQPDSLTYFLTVANWVLTGLFTSEMIVKLFGLGFWDYIRDSFNIFDALVVTISLVEIILSTVAGLNAARALRVLKALRVLRLFKLFRYMQSLRRIGEILLSAFTSFAAIATLLMLFWLVFSIIGMHVFGNKDLDTYNWPNFSTFLFSLISTWNVLNLENWTNIMYATIRVTDWGSSMFFVMWIVIGRYIFLTLFLAVTLEAFEAKYDANAVRMGAKGGGFTSLLGSIWTGASSLRSGLSSKANSLLSSVRSSRSSRSSRGSGSGRGPARKGGEPDGPGHGGWSGGAGAGIDPTTQPSQLPPGIGYLEDAQAAAAAQYGDGRANLQKMYTIKQWIDTGNMDVLKAETAADISVSRRAGDASPSRNPVGPGGLGGAGAGGEGDTAVANGGSWPSSPLATRPLALPRGIPPSDASGDIPIHFGGGARAGRGMPYIDDSAAQSRASSEEAVAAARAGAATSADAPGRAVGEGLDLDPAGRTDSALLRNQQRAQQQQQQPLSEQQGSQASAQPGTSLSDSRSATETGLIGPRTSTGPYLQSLTLAVRRDLEGVVPLLEEDGATELDDIVASAPGGAPAGGAANGGTIWARPPPSPLFRATCTSAAADGDELILARAHGRSRLVRSSTSIDTTMRAPTGVLGASYSFKAEPSADDLPPHKTTTAPEWQGPLPSPPRESSVLSAVSPGVPAPGRRRQELAEPVEPRADGAVPPGDAAAGARGSGGVPVSMGLEGRAVGAGGGEDGYQDLLDSFMDTSGRFVATGGVAPGHSAPAAGVGAAAGGGPPGSSSCDAMPPARPSVGQEVIMATFQDMLLPMGVEAASGAQGQAGYDSHALATVPGWSAQAVRALSRHGSSITRRPQLLGAWGEEGEGQRGGQDVSLQRAAVAQAQQPSMVSLGEGAQPGAAGRQQQQQQLFAADSAALLALADELDNSLTGADGAAARPTTAPAGSGGLHHSGSSRGTTGREVPPLSPPPMGPATGVSGSAATSSSAADLSGRDAPHGPRPNGSARQPSRVARVVVGGAGQGELEPSSEMDGGSGNGRPGSGSGSGGGPSSSGYGYGASQGQSLQDSAHSLDAMGIAANRQRGSQTGVVVAAAAATAEGDGAAARPLSGQPSSPWRQSPGQVWDSARQRQLQQQHQHQHPRNSNTGDVTIGSQVDSSSGRGSSLDAIGSGDDDGRKGGRRRGGGDGRGDDDDEGADPLLGGACQRSGGSAGSGSGGKPYGPGRDRLSSAALQGGGGGKAGASGVLLRDDGDAGTGRRGDKGPAMRRISEAGSVASDTVSRCDSFDSHASGTSHGSGADSGDDDRGRKRFRKRRRASILIAGTGKSFWIWDEDHPAREWAYWLVTHKRFEYTMFALILLNCVSMALENPYIEPGSPMDKALFWSNVSFTIIFTFEALVKTFAYTFVAYIKRITNQVDFVIVVTSLLEIVLAAVTTSVEAVSALRALRAIKPLRLLTRSAGMRLVFKSVTMSLMSMANVSIVCILFFLIFAILGVQLFSGRFYRCNDDSVNLKTECVGTFTDPLTNTVAERTWSNDFPNFDNTGNALLCCFITATLNGYTEIMINAMSAPNEPGHQPRQFLNPGAFFWFFGFIVVCAFTLLNLYVGVIFSQFSKIRMISETGSAFLTSDQNEWAELTKMVFRLKPPDKAQLPTGKVRHFFHVMIHTKSFDLFILLIILLNVGFLTATWYGEPASYTHQKNLANIVFISIFAAEAAAKIFALGWVGYFKVAWNKLDFLLLVLGILDLIVSMLSSNFLRVLRIFRVLRLIGLVRLSHFAQLVRSVKGVQSLFSTLIYSLPAFGNVGALIGLFFFMYAYVGMFMFGKVQYGETLSRQVNFHNFWQALLVLMRVATGDNWTGIMFDCMVQPPRCNKSAGGCGTYLAVPFFLTFVLLVYVILLNLFTAVIIETFEKTHEQEEWKLSPQALEDFVTLWSEYDDGSGTIMPRHLEELLLRLDPPLGLGPYADNKDVLRFVYDLDIPLINARVPFHKTAFELVKRCSQATMPEGAIKEQIHRLVDKFFRELPTQDEMLNFSVAITVMKVQRKWRTRMRAAKLMRKKRWRQDRQAAPQYPEIVANKALVAEKYEAYRESLREAAKAWEVSQLSFNRKPDKAEVARRMEPRWRFSAKYAPSSLVAATSEKTGLLGLGKRVAHVNKLVGGLLRVGGLLGGGNGGGAGDSAAGRSPQATQSGEQGGMWASPVGSGDARGAGAGGGDMGVTSPLPRLLRAITHGSAPRASYSGGSGWAGLISPSGPQPDCGSVGGGRRRQPVPSVMGGSGGGEGVEGLVLSGSRTSHPSLNLSPMAARRPPGMVSNDGGTSAAMLSLGTSRGNW